MAVLPTESFKYLPLRRSILENEFEVYQTLWLVIFHKTYRLSESLSRLFELLFELYLLPLCVWKILGACVHYENHAEKLQEFVEEIILFGFCFSLKFVGATSDVIFKLELLRKKQVRFHLATSQLPNSSLTSLLWLFQPGDLTNI